MKVCNRCLMAIEAHEGAQTHRKIYVDDAQYYDSTEEYEHDSTCEWCEENGFDELYEI